MIETLEQKVGFNPLDLAGLASQVAGGRYSTERNNPNYVAAAIDNFEKSMSESEMVKYGDHLIDLKEAHVQAMNTMQKPRNGAAKYHLNDFLINHFNHMEEGYASTLAKAKLKELNEALAKFGYSEKLNVDENSAIKDLILDGEAYKKASDKNKAISDSVMYLQHALIEMAGSKLLNDSIASTVKHYNEALKPKEEKKSEEAELKEAA